MQVWSAQAGSFSPRERFTATFSQPTLSQYFQEVLETWQPELVHVQHLMGLPVSVIKILQRQEIPYLITLHDFWWVCSNAQLLTNYDQKVCAGPNAYLNCARCLLARANKSAWWPVGAPLAGVVAWRNHLLRDAIFSAECLIAPTPFVKNWYVKHGLPAKKIMVLPHGLDLSHAIEQKKRENDSIVRFGYIGGLSPQKGVDILLQAFNALNKPAELWIAGDEQAFPDYVSQLHNSAGPNVRFLGKLERAGVWQMLAELDAIVVPSIWYETFSIIISEAFAAGVPVIVSQIGALSDRVQNGIDGLLFEPGNVDSLLNAMRRFVSEANLQSTMRANIQPQFSLSDHVKQLQIIYQQILTSR